MSSCLKRFPKSFSRKISRIFFRVFFQKSSVSRIVPKHVKGGPLGLFEHSFFCKKEKVKGDLLETMKKFAKKLSQLIKFEK